MASLFNTVWTSSSEESDTEHVSEAVPKKTGASRAPPRLLLSDSDDEKKRVVIPVKDKRANELNEVIKSISNSMKIKDVSKVLDLFITLTLVFEKGKFSFTADARIGKVYLRALFDVEKFINEQWENKARLNKLNSKALNTLKQRWKKYTKDFQTELDYYKQNPSLSSDSDTENTPSPLSPPPPILDPAPATEPKPPASPDNSWSDISDSDRDLTTSDSDSDDPSSRFGKLTARYFLKSYTKAKAAGAKRERTTEPKYDSEGEEIKEKGKRTKEEIEQAKLGMKEQVEELTVERVLNEEEKILLLRGRTTERPTLLVDRLIDLQGRAREAKLGEALSLRLMFRIISAVFDLKPNPTNAFQQGRKWELSLKYIRDMLEQLLENPDVQLRETYTEGDEQNEEIEVVGDPVMWVERLNDQMFTLLQNTDHNSFLYIERLRDDATLFVIFNKLDDFLKSTNAETSSFVRLALLRLEHHYYKPIALLKATYYKDENEDPNEIVGRMAEFVIANDKKDQFVRAVLYFVYFQAINDNWSKAQSLMLSHRVQDSIQQYPKPVQILHNRVMAQLGICAFRHGQLDVAHDILLDLTSNSRLKEHLAQGFNPRSLDAEQEPIAMKFILPYHLHVCVELIECVYMTSAMIKEVPYMASKEFETKKRLISRLFHNQLKNREKQPIAGPPDYSRDYVIAAAYRMREGKWQECCEMVLNIRVWSLFKREKEIKKMMTARIKETTLETYLYGFSQAYSSIGLSSLAQKFDLPETTVSKIVSQLIIAHKLQASLDEPSRTIIIHSSQPNRLQQLSMRLSERLDSLASANQEMAKFKQISFPQQEYQRNRH